MAAKKSERADLIVVGSEPAAAVAALRGLALGLSVVLVRNDPSKLPDAAAAWLAPPGIDMCKQCGITAGDVEMTEFQGISLHSGDLRRRLDVAAEDLRGWIVDCAVFERALRKRAVADGARAIKDHVDAVQIGDDELCLTLAGGTRCAAAY